MKKKYIIKLAHPMREMLAEIVFGLDNFDLADASKSMILSNRKKERDIVFPRSTPSGNFRGYILGCIARIQKKLGLINFRIVWEKDCDILVAHGGFLITNKPYVTYIEKATQLYGYTAKNYYKPLSLFMLRRFLRNGKLKKIFLLSQAAFDGMVNIASFDDELRGLIRNKGVVVYPPISRPGEPDIDRFRGVKDGIRFLYISNNFYGKGGLELFHAFVRLREEMRDIRLLIITDIKSIEEVDLQSILASDGVELHDFVFTREELFGKFFDTCHVLCYPTYSDSFSSVVNEAIVSYLPVITTDFYAIPERVRDGYNGFVCRSPFPNYDERFVISSEHFTDQLHFHEIIVKSRKEGKLKSIEDFLFEKMHLLATKKEMLYRMASNNKRFCEEKLDPDMIRGKINRVFGEAIK